MSKHNRTSKQENILLEELEEKKLSKKMTIECLAASICFSLILLLSFHSIDPLPMDRSDPINNHATLLIIFSALSLFSAVFYQNTR